MEQRTNELLARVRQGMEVYDADGDHIGNVEFVQMGDEDPTNLGVETATDDRPELRDSSLVEDVARAFVTEDNVPEELAERMRRYGYIRLDAGLLRSDRFVMHDQISSVTEDRVNLNVKGDGLLKS